MATNTTDAMDEKGTDIEETADELVGSLADQIGRSFTIGTDDEWCDHHYYRPADTVVVYDPQTQEIDHREYLDGATVESWYRYVQDERGWIKLGQLAGAGMKADKARKLGEL